MIHELFRIFNWMGSEWVLMTLIALSVLTLWVILQRWFEIEKMSKVSGRFWNEHAETWFQNADSHSWETDIESMKANYPCLEADTLDVIKRSKSQKGVETDKIVAGYLGQRKLKMEKYIGILGTVGSNAPFIGLLGTVLGIIRSFHNMSVEGLGASMDNIGAGIAEALVATAIGLVVAVPAVIFFNILNKRISTLVKRAESVSLLAMSQGNNERR